MKRWLMIATLTLAGCSSDGTTPLGRLVPSIRAGLLGPAAPPEAVVEPTREALNQIPYATIGFNYGTAPRVFMIPLADNGGYLIYQDVARRGIVMRGGAVAGTEGLGEDLLGVRFQQDDPVVSPTPPRAWPASVVRSYEYRLRDSVSYQVTPACTFERQGSQTIEIVELQFPVMRIDERCQTADRSFVNSYWVADDGFIWASRQWLGPKLETAYIEIVRPYGG